MDAALFLLLDKIKESPHLVRNSKKKVWAGQEVLQDEVTFDYDSTVLFRFSKLAEWTYQYLPNRFRSENYECLLLDDAILNEIDMYQNHRIEDSSALVYLKIIEQLLDGCNDWAFLFLESWDTIEECYVLNINDTVNMFLKKMDWNNKKIGFVCSCPVA